MNILINHSLRSEYSDTIDATAGKVSGVVSVNRRDKSLITLCMNASHRAWSGGGRYFRNAAIALEHYRSAEMKAIIAAAIEFSEAKENA